MKKKLKGVLLICIADLLFLGLYSYLTSYNSNISYVASSFKKVEVDELELNFDYFEKEFTIKKSSDRDFRILQLTDLHIGGSNASYNNDVKAFNTMYKLIEYSKPDLIILTGDMLFSSILSRNINNENAAIALKIFMDNVGIPWTIVFGNHDYEVYNTANQEQISKIFSTSDNFLLYHWFASDGKLYSNQKISVLNANGDINTALYLLDSNLLTDKDISGEAITWYNNAVFSINKKYKKNVPSLLFLHEPLFEYEVAWESYSKGGNINYYFGKKREDVCYELKTSLFDTILRLESTKGIFCGHDHLNDFSLDYKGVRLTYGKSIDYITYHGIGDRTEQRGGTLIKIKDDSSFEVVPIKYESI